MANEVHTVTTSFNKGFTQQLKKKQQERIFKYKKKITWIDLKLQFYTLNFLYFKWLIVKNKFS